ncbi:alkaline phosphatase family protein [Virgibacillus salexigens]|uniref:Phosphodiesterase n=1 Tax=Virgibacillus kapii TaxID=1638645 RepID=A0ABQ2DJZ1_9BACI|nr:MULTISPECIES: alkaline phosphatase family protein [Virgibacillus]MYL40202.1 hypothetical protein [Virgibacillus massiliensis]GGJ60806.1 hypothetical protein GCM10007111_23710 [Virgibacillus kapii]
MEKKPIILLNIDSLMAHPLELAVQTGRAPALQFLMENGLYDPAMVSSFPTMSVTIDSSLLTGTYADQHHIPGLSWFDMEKNQFVNYGTGFRETFRLGMRRSIHQMLYALNNEHLSHHVSTIYEELAKEGISSGSINSFVYRGNVPHRLKTPRFLSAFTYFKNGEWSTQATSLFSLGTFSKIRPTAFTPQIAAGNLKYTARELRYLIRKNKLPAFTFCIFQDMDARLHFKGPMDIKGIVKVDRQIQKILNMYSDWNEAIKQSIWIVIGDNGHSATGIKYKDVVIDLRKVLTKYRIAKIQRSIQKKDQLAFCVNQRMAYIYKLDDKVQTHAIIKQLKHDHRIDVIAWKEKGSVYVESGMNKGRLTFHPNGEDQDVYGQFWSLEGRLDLLDISWQGNKLQYGDFPDALARLYGALFSQQANCIVVNAKPGCEFKAQSTPFHLSGAAHGSLHKQESLVPLIIAGTKMKPRFSRIVDMKSFIIALVEQYKGKGK